MNCEFTFRPIGADWPHERKSRPQRSRFKARHSQTLALLSRELGYLNVRSAVIQIDLRERDIRLDGLPRANAPEPAFPGVILSFESKYGPLKYATDTFDRWRDNLRAIGLGLEALRKVDRYGITRRGEQYTGWKQLPAAVEAVGDLPTAAAFIAAHSGVSVADLSFLDRLKDAFRIASQKLHPDKGGSAEQFDRLVKAKQLIESKGGVR